jgi:hypothetical protein
MHINLIIFPLIILLGLIFGSSDSPKNRKRYIIFVTIILMLEASLRSLSVGSDTASYYNQFYNIQGMTWSEIWQRVIERYLHNISDYDVGYIVLQKVIGLFTSSWQVFVFLAQLTFFIPLGKLMYRYSNKMIQLVFAYVLYVALFHISALSGGRQLYAIGMSIMSFMYLNQKKYTISIMYILLGTLIHMTCLLGFLPIILSKLKINLFKKIHLITLGLVPIVIVSVNRIIVFMGSAVGMEKYASYGTGEIMGGAWTFISLLLLSSVFIYFAFKKKDLQQNKSLANLYTMVPLFTFFGPLIHSNGSMIRISMYFHLYLMLLIPFALDKIFKGNFRIVVYIIVILTLLILSLRDGGLIYHFYWQEPHLFYLY